MEPSQCCPALGFTCYARALQDEAGNPGCAPCVCGASTVLWEGGGEAEGGRRSAGGAGGGQGCAEPDRGGSRARQAAEAAHGVGCSILMWSG